MPKSKPKFQSQFVSKRIGKMKNLIAQAASKSKIKLPPTNNK